MRSSITSTAPPSSSTGSQRCGPSWCCACSPKASKSPCCRDPVVGVLGRERRGPASLRRADLRGSWPGLHGPKPPRAANPGMQSYMDSPALIHAPGMSAVPFKVNADRRHRIPRQQHRITNWSEYDAALRQRGSLTVWFTDEAIAAWRAEPRTTRGGQPHYSALAITTALTLRAVFRLPLRQTEGLIGSVIRLLGLDLAVPDHSTLSRRAETLAVPRPPSSAEPLHLLVDSTGLKLSGAGEWLVETHGTSRRRSWRKLHISVDTDTGRIVAATLTTNDVDDGSQVGTWLDQIDGPIASFTADGAYDQDGVYGEIAERHPDTAVIVPPRSSAVPSKTAETAPTQRDRHLQLIAERGRMGWQKASGYNLRALVEADIGRWKGVWRDAALADERPPGDRRSGCCRRPEPHAGAGTPELRPYHMKPRKLGITLSTRAIALQNRARSRAR